MKKIALLFLALLIALALFSCQNQSNDLSATTSNETIDSTDINTNSLEVSFENATNLFQHYPDTHRNIGELQSETQEILLLEGKFYQSYVSSSCNLRYIFINSSEYTMSAEWDWLPIGTDNTYSLELLGKINEEYK